MSLDLPGFADPVHDAQTTFRAVLDAIARPGEIRPAGHGLTPPAPLHPATAALLLTLADAETPLHLAAAFAPAADWLRFHAGAPITEDATAATFLITDTLPDLMALPAGTDEEPQAGVTILLQVASLTGGAPCRIAGPGLAAPATLASTGLPADFPARWADNHARFPRGIDLILCADDQLLALPRSLAITES